jgi:phosphoglycerate dehydrogenase-like enzyme
MNQLEKMLFASLLILSPALAQAQMPQDLSAAIAEMALEEHEPAVRDVPGWRKPEKVYINFSAYGPKDELPMMLESAQKAVGDVEIVQIDGKPGVDIINNAEAMVGRCNPDILATAPKLRWFQHSSHGIEDCLNPTVAARDFIMTNAQHTSGPPIAEHAIAMMMMLGRGLHVFHSAQAQGEWIDRDIPYPIIEIGGKTMLIAGLGGIGTEVARRAHALGMTVLATRNSSREGPDFVEYVGLSDELLELAKRADVVVNALPLTEDTRGLFNKQFFDTVKKGAIFISFGRGESTVTADLIAALKDGRISGAGLDVTDPEPLPQGHELWQQPNVIITPHMASTTDQGRWRRWVVVLENLRRYVNGDKLLSVVDKKRGY